MAVVKIKKQKESKSVSQKRELKFGNYKNCLEPTQLGNKCIVQKKMKLIKAVLKKVIKNLLKNNKLILKAQQRFKSERHNVFTEEIDKIALGSNDDKRMQSIDSIETYAC